MPLAHSLNKVKKNLSKSTGSMHIKGRKFKQLNRATLRDRKLTNKKMRSKEQKESELSVVRFYQEEAQKSSNEETFTLGDIRTFMDRYLARHDEEIEKLKNERRPGRPASTRQISLESAIKHDKHVYSTGCMVPDLRNKETVVYLRNWNGSLGGVTAMKFFQLNEASSEERDEDMT